MARILHLIPALSGGGAERQLALIAPAQVARGHEVHIGFISPAVPSALANNPGVHLHQLEAVGHHDPALLFRLGRLIRSSRADIVQTWMLMMDVLGGSAALLARKPWVLSERSDSANYPASIKASARVLLGKRANVIVANSRGGAEYWRDCGVPTNRIAQIGNAVDVNAIHAAPQPVLPAEIADRPLVLFIGRFSDEKKPLVVIDALAQVMRETDVVAMLCGTGPLHSQMTEAIALHDLSHRIVMAGYCNDVYGLLNIAHACIAISSHEGSPNVVHEAIAASCPLVLTDIPAYRHLVHNGGALFVAVNDVDATARAIVETVANVAEAKNRAAFAHEQSMPASAASIAEMLDDVYRSHHCI